MKHGADGGRGRGPGGRAGVPQTTAGGGLRGWLFRLAAVVLVPLLLLGGLELGLRVGGYGYPTAFFKRVRVDDRDEYVENDKFGLRFFPPALARSPPPVVMAAHKPTGSYRVFLFGESAAMGDPQPAYSMGRYLEVLLRERFPATQFEVIAVAMTAINSHVILPIARECAGHQGDLWVVYMGNNEQAGPFGAATVFGPQAPSLRLARAWIALRATRVGQLVAALGQRLQGPADQPAVWEGLKMFQDRQIPPGDPRRDLVVEHFERNLEDLVRVGIKAGAQIVLSTVAVNLRDSSPFASQHRAALSGSDLTSWEGRYRAGVAAQTARRPQKALSALDGAAALDARFADLEFRRGECLLALTNRAEARRAFESARDDDAVPLRADGRLNAIVTKVASAFAGQGVVALDAIAVLAPYAEGGIPGQESFYEHVHLTYGGNYHLARALAEKVAGQLPSALTARARPDWASQDLCERRLGLTDWNRAAVLENVLQRIAEAPFTNRLSHPKAVAALYDQLAATKARMTPTAAPLARRVYEEALLRAPADHRLHQNYAEFLEATGLLVEATLQWRQVRDLIPHHHVAWFQMGRLLARQKKYPEAQAALEQALRLRPDLIEGYLELGRLLAARGQSELAMAQYARARKCRPGDARVLVQMADVLAAEHKRADALAALRQAIQIRPDYWEPHYLLGVELAADGKLEPARAEFAETARLRPDYARAHFNLAVALAKLERWSEAEAEFRQTLKLEPLNQAARQRLEAIGALQRRNASPNSSEVPIPLRPREGP